MAILAKQQACNTQNLAERPVKPQLLALPRRQSVFLLSTVAVSVLQARPGQASPLPATCTSRLPTAVNRPKVTATMASAAGQRKKVLVTGAGGKTGKIVLQKLLQLPEQYSVRGFVHSDKSAHKVQQETGLDASAIFTGDITDPSSSSLSNALEGVDAVVIATSASPKLVFTSLPKAIFSKLWGGSGFPDFTYPQMPEQVDWLGQKHQIDAAARAGVKKVVLISSMGGTDPGYVLNKMGNGNILVFKRKAEEYLISQSQLDHTIIHPGGLVDDRGGERELVIGVDDELMKVEHKRIPRADVAELSVQSISLPQASNRSIDVISKPPPGSTDFAALFGGMTKNCSYSLPAQSLS